MVHFITTFAHDNPAGFTFCTLLIVLFVIMLVCECRAEGRMPKSKEDVQHCSKCRRLLDPNGLCPYCLDIDEPEDSLASPASSYLIEGMSREKLIKLCKRWEKAHCEAGFTGSEYYADPERVFQRVREQRGLLHRIKSEAGCLPRGTAFERKREAACLPRGTAFERKREG